MSSRPLAIVTGASSGIGFELAKLCAQNVFDLLVAADEHLILQVARDMRARGRGRILITGSIAGLMPGSFQAVYNGSKAIINSFAIALREELKDTGVTVTCLMPGATETGFFERADMLDTRVATQEKDDPAGVAKAGFDAMHKGEADVVTGWKNKLQATLAHVTPPARLSEKHRHMAEPGSGEA